MSAEQLAIASRNYAEAVSANEDAKKRAEAIQDRITAAHTRQAEITSIRLSGSATEGNNAEYACLVGDISALAEMLDRAKQAVADLDPQPAKQALQDANKAHIREQDQAAFDLLTQKASELDALLCKAVRELHSFGQKLGNVSLVMSWKPSQALRESIQYGRTP
jgi:hypothetical protein